MSALALHRAAIVAKLRSVEAIGIVHDEEPYARSEGDFRAMYAWDDGYGEPQIRGWFLRRTGTLERETAIGRTLNTFSWEIRGFASLDSVRSTGKAFDDLVEAVRLAFRLDPQLGGAADPGPLSDRTGVQVADAGPVMFAGALCHSVKLQLQTHALLDQGE